MKRIALVVGSWLVLLAGCSKTPCTTSSECGSGEQCVAAQCSALSCDSVYFAVNPATGQCTPLAPCANDPAVRGWAPCANPCAGLRENDCISDSRCQPSYTSPLTETPPGCANGIGGSNGGFPGIDLGVPSADGGTPSGGGGFVPPTDCSGAPKMFAGCAPVPTLHDQCDSHDAASCAADARCQLEQLACDCAPSPDLGACDCGGVLQPSCRVKFCGQLSEDECKQRPDCTTQPGPQFRATGRSAPQDFFGCFDRFSGSCFGLGEKDCERSALCHPVGTSCFCPASTSCNCDGGHFLYCAANDGVRHCSDDHDCHGDERCNHGDECPAPGIGTQGVGGSCAGVCVPQGCKGYGEAQCNADRHCEPVYALNCSPYASQGGGGFCGGGFPASSPNAGAPAPDSCSCEPSFVSCESAGEGCDPEKSILVRDPAILDDPFWAFPRVLGLVTGADANAVSDNLFAQIGTDATIGGKLAAARPAARDFLAGLPRGTDGLIDAARIPLQPTSLSNRLDLADASSCGEARITYALTVGVQDRRHRMTMIIELNQPYDGDGCRTIARTWKALSNLDGAALQAALQAIYTPLLTPANLKQVRTNEFLVGPETAQPPPPPSGSARAVWELREFHLGADARLHQVLLPLSVDPAQVTAPDFVLWAMNNRTALQKGTVTFPAAYQMPTASEDGARLSTNSGDVVLDDIVDRAGCRGCHTSATNTAFAHVAERYKGTGRAEISQFLQGELKKRAQHLGALAAGAETAILDVRAMH